MITAALKILLQQLLDQTTIPWLRLLYLYPTGVTENCCILWRRIERIVPYLDIPMQHVNDNILRLMNRRYTAEQLFID